LANSLTSNKTGESYFFAFKVSIPATIAQSENLQHSSVMRSLLRTVIFYASNERTKLLLGNWKVRRGVCRNRVLQNFGTYESASQLHVNAAKNKFW